VYSLISSQPIANGRPVDEIVLLPSISRALILSGKCLEHSLWFTVDLTVDSQVHFYTLPSLDVVPYQIIRPIRHVVAFVVDDRHLRRPVSMLGASGGEAVDFCVIKKKELVLYTLRDKLVYLKVCPSQLRLCVIC
jgi:vacuolar protein sorting-associated protein 3